MLVVLEIQTATTKVTKRYLIHSLLMTPTKGVCDVQEQVCTCDEGWIGLSCSFGKWIWISLLSTTLQWMNSALEIQLFVLVMDNATQKLMSVLVNILGLEILVQN